MKKNTMRTILFVVASLIVIALVVVGGSWLIQQSQQDDTDTIQSQQQEESSSKSISKAKAEKIAVDAYGGTVKETESDDYHGSPAWEVELRDSKYGRIEVKIDKKTGEILHYEKD